MTIQQCYNQMNADYEGTLRRLRDDKRIQKYMLLFLKDPTYRDLCDAVACGRHEDIFRAAHTLKGVAENLGFTALCQYSAAMQRFIKSGDSSQDAASLLLHIELAYRQTVEAILRFQSEMDDGDEFPGR